MTHSLLRHSHSHTHTQSSAASQQIVPEAMASLTGSALVDYGLGVCTLLCAFYCYLRHSQRYWETRGVPYIKSNLLFGTFKDVVFGKLTVFENFAKMYKQLEGERFGGYFEFTKPNLIIIDPKLVDHVLVKDFTHFTDRGFGTVDLKNDPLSAGLVHLSGQQWRHLRYKLTPTFTSGKLKGMFDQILNCVEDLLKNIEKHSGVSGSLDGKKILSSFTTDVIASCAFGLQFSSESEKDVFKNFASEMFTPSKLQLTRMILMLHWPQFSKFLGLKMFSKEATQYIMEMTSKIIKHREQTNTTRSDFLQLLLTLRDQEKSGKVINVNDSLQEEDIHLQQPGYKLSTKDNIDLTNEVLAAQMFLFMGAGSDTVSNTLNLTLYCIATNPTEQEKVQREVDEVLAKHGGQWSYLAVTEMTYLDQVLQEGMRIHPFSPALQRVCTTPYKMPGSDLFLEVGQRVVIPVSPVHMDSRYYPDPNTFRPDRFKGNNYRPSSTYLPFGDGPRMCIAMRFAVLEMKVCLARLLSEYSVTVGAKTLEPLQMEPRTIMPLVKGGIWLDFQKRKL